MKTTTIILVFTLLSACASTSDTPRQIEECRKITDKNFRDQCIADALQEQRDDALIEETFEDDG
ncbi:MAG: hypothetical protein AAGJ84_07655 [Pseudomonadota bacterium]